MTEQPKRDVAADRGELDAMLDRAERRGDVVFPFVYAIVSHYLTRCESLESDVARVEGERDHAARMVEAAITHFAECGECPPGEHQACRALVTSINDQPAEPPLEFCVRCVRDYLDQKVKEAATHA